MKRAALHAATAAAAHLRGAAVLAHGGAAAATRGAARSLGRAGAALGDVVAGGASAVSVAGAALTPGAGPERAPAPPRDLASTWLVALVSAAMGFLSALGLAASNGADALAASWTDDLRSTLTISLELPDDPDEANAALRRAIEAIDGAPGVASARPLEGADVAALLEPWLGDDEDLLTDVPLPTLVDVRLEPGAVAPVEVVEARLDAARVSAQVDAHGEWADRLAPAAAKIRLLAHAGLAIVAAAAGMMVALACLTAMSAQRRMISVLKIVGARDSFIAAMFMRRYQLLAFLGSAVGVAGAAVMVVGGAPDAGGLAAELTPLAPSLKPNPWIWAQFAAAPLAFALIAAAASWIAVTFALQSADP